MTADHRSDSGRQLTVAELLKQYGDGGSGGPRRRRRAEEQDSPQSNGQAPGERPDLAGPGDAGAQTSGAINAVGERGWVPGTGFDHAASLWAPSQSDPATEQLPRFHGTAQESRENDAVQDTAPVIGVPTRVGSSAISDGGPPTGQVSRAELFDDLEESTEERVWDDAGRDGASRDGASRDGASRDGASRDGASRDGASREDGAEGEQGSRAARRARAAQTPTVPPATDAPATRPVGWAGLIAQWLLGAVGGAALWVGFRYLWLHYPVAALIAAVLATAGLVLLVRAIRRSDDVQTTMLAVLVGLVVTISPAVLLLAVR
ncbi:MAG: hypothetical protein JO100_16385 [Pseudonocardia sp.]|nr:hypothetical protein [Pseudonocardia sp.]